MEKLESQLNEILSKKDLLKNVEKEWFGLSNRLKTQERRLQQLQYDLQKEVSSDKGGLGCIIQIVILGYIVISIFVIGFISNYPEFTIIGVISLIILGLIPGFFFWVRGSGKKDVNNIKEKILSQEGNKKKTEVEIMEISPEIKKLTSGISSLEESYSLVVIESLQEIFDKNNNLEIDELEKSDDFMLLVQTNQQKIIEFDKSENKNYIKLFIQLHERIEFTRDNVNSLFKQILDFKGPYDGNINHKSLIQVIENEIHFYNVLLTNSIVMVSSLINDDRITFYKIYQSFDKLDIFNSNFENESLKQLKTINNNLIEVVNSIEQMNFSITSELQELNYITEKNTELIQENLNQINSSINLNTLINSINTYQNYKINKNTKSLRP